MAFSLWVRIVPEGQRRRPGVELARSWWLAAARDVSGCPTFCAPRFLPLVIGSSAELGSPLALIDGGPSSMTRSLLRDDASNRPSAPHGSPARLFTGENMLALTDNVRGAGRAS